MTGHCYWRPKGTLRWRFGYITEGPDASTCRMGAYAGQVATAPILSRKDIELKEYKDHLR